MQFILSADSKLNVSHSTIEKQRRDRINSLIDEVLGHGDLANTCTTLPAAVA
jgi:hypothetical protein